MTQLPATYHSHIPAHHGKYIWDNFCYHLHLGSGTVYLPPCQTQGAQLIHILDFVWDCVGCICQFVFLASEFVTDGWWNMSVYLSGAWVNFVACINIWLNFLPLEVSFLAYKWEVTIRIRQSLVNPEYSCECVLVLISYFSIWLLVFYGQSTVDFCWIHAAVQMKLT